MPWIIIDIMIKICEKFFLRAMSIEVRLSVRFLNMDDTFLFPRELHLIPSPL